MAVTAAHITNNSLALTPTPDAPISTSDATLSAMQDLVKSQENTNKKIVEMADKVLEKMNKKPESNWPAKRIAKYGAGTAALVYLAHPQLLQMAQKVPFFGTILLKSGDAVPSGVGALNDLADAGGAVLTGAGAVVSGIRQAASYFIKTKPTPKSTEEVAALGTSFFTNLFVYGMPIKIATAVLNLAVPGRNEFVPIKFSHIVAASAIQAAVPGQWRELGSAVLEKVASEDGVNWAMTGAVAAVAVKALNLLVSCTRFDPPLGKKTFVLLTGFLLAPPEQLSALTGTIKDKAGEFVSESAPIVKKGFTKFANSAFANATSTLASAAGSAAGSAASMFAKSGFVNATSALASAAAEKLSNFGSAVSQKWSEVKSEAPEKLSEFGSAVSHAARETAITAGVMGAAVKVFNVFARNRGFNSPLGTGTVAGLAIGAEILAENQFGAKTVEMVSEGASFVKDTSYNLWSAAGEKWSDFKSAVPTMTDISSAAGEKWSDFKSAVPTMTDISSAAGEKWSDLKSGIGNAASSAYNALPSVISPSPTTIATGVTAVALAIFARPTFRFLRWVGN